MKMMMWQQADLVVQAEKREWEHLADVAAATVDAAAIDVAVAVVVSDVVAIDVERRDAVDFVNVDDFDLYSWNVAAESDDDDLE